MSISKTVFSAFGLAYCKCYKSPSLNTFRLDHRNGIKMWSTLFYPTVAFKLTDIGEGIKEVTVKRCYMKPHQRVSQFEDICDVESDKATVTITSRFDGFVKKIHFEEGDVVAVGSTLLDIELDEPTDKENGVTEVADSIAATELGGDGDHEIVKTMEPTHIKSQHPTFEDEGGGSGQSCEKALATPAVRRIAKEHGIDINCIPATGKQGRVSKEDILIYLNQPRLDHNQRKPAVCEFGENTACLERGTDALLTTAESAVSSSITSQPITAYRKVMFKTMTESNKIPTLTLSDEIDVTNLELLRKALKSDLEKDKVKLTLLAFVVKAISLSLHQFPILNARLEYETIEYLGSHNIGVAVDTPAGLVVPNIKNVQRLSIRQIAVEAQRLQTLAADGKLSLADTNGGTFTLSNVGSIAGTVVKPLILPPQVAIVGIGRIRHLPRFDQNEVVKKCSVINASWAADHRVIDGATVARFSNAVKRYLENPGLLAVDS